MIADRLLSADCKRGRRKGATSKNVKNRQKVSKSFSTLFDNFARHLFPFFRPLLQSADLAPCSLSTARVSHDSLWRSMQYATSMKKDNVPAMLSLKGTASLEQLWKVNLCFSRARGRPTVLKPDIPDFEREFLGLLSDSHPVNQAPKKHINIKKWGPKIGP